MEQQQSDRLQVAAIQMNAGLDKAANLDRAERLVARAAASGSRLVVLPELFNLYGDLSLAAAQAETLQGPSATRMCNWAKQHDVWLAGSIVGRLSGDSAKPSNVALLIGPDGSLRSKYAKIHLFDIDVPGKATSRESDHIAAGTEVVCEPIEWTRAGLAICYDLRFPELFRCLIDRGANLLLIPSAFTAATGKDHWELLVRARAIENQAYVIAANQVGAHQPSSASFGHSMIVDPWGSVIAAANGKDEAIISAEICRTQIETVRSQLPAISNRRLP